MPGKQVEVRERGAEFVAAREAVGHAMQCPVVARSQRLNLIAVSLLARAEKLQGAISQGAKMVDGANRWMQDTFGVELPESSPVVANAIDTMSDAALAAMNYFLRDAKMFVAKVEQLQKQYENLPEGEQKNFIAGLGADTPNNGMKIPKGVIIAALGGLALWFFGNHLWHELEPTLYGDDNDDS